MMCKCASLPFLTGCLGSCLLVVSVTTALHAFFFSVVYAETTKARDGVFLHMLELKRQYLTDISILLPPRPHAC